MPLNPLSKKLMTAGAVVCAGGIAIAVIQEGVGTYAVWKGAFIALMGIGMFLHGWLRKTGVE
jgi:hypothetical protein